MSPLPVWVIGLLLATTLIFTLAMDTIKLAVFARLRVDESPASPKHAQAGTFKRSSMDRALPNLT
jgi:hypothetical protein